MKWLIPLVILIAINLDSASAALVNGDFETGDFSGWTWTPDANPSPFLNPTVTTFDGSNAFQVNPGNNGAGATPRQGGTLSQSVMLVAGVPIHLTGSLAIEQANLASQSDGGTITVSVAGNQIHLLEIFSMTPGQIVRESFDTDFTPLVSGAAEYSISFIRGFSSSTGGPFHYADDLTFTPGTVDPVAPVPEPSTLALLSLGLLALIRRRRRQA